MIKVIVNDYELELFEDTVVALSKKSATIGNLQNRFSSFTNKFNVPLTRSNRLALGITQFQDNSGTPYDSLTGKIISGGIEIASNVSVIIESVSDTISLSIRAGNGSLFDKLNRTKLNQIDASDLYQRWNQPNVVASLMNDWTDSILFPVSNPEIQSLVFPTVMSDAMPPFWFVKALFIRISTLFGYTWTGDTFTNDQFEKLLLNINNLTISQTFADTFFFEATQIPVNFFPSATSQGFYPRLTAVTDQWGFISTNTIAGNSVDGYALPVPGTYAFQYDWEFDVSTVDLPIVNIQIFVKDFLLGTETIVTDYPVPGIVSPSSQSGTITGEFTFNDYYGSYSNGRAVVFARYFAGTAGGAIIEVTGGNFKLLSIKAPETHYNRPFSFSDQLPDWTIGKFIKEVANIFGAVYNVDELTREIEITRLDEIAANKNFAIDWSNKLDLSQSIEVTYIVEGIGKTTKLQWNKDILYAYEFIVDNEQLPETANYIKSETDYSEAVTLGGQTLPTININEWDSTEVKIKINSDARFAMLGENTDNVNVVSGIFFNSVSPFKFAYFDYLNSEHSLDWGVLFSRYFEPLITPMTDKIQRVTCFVRLNDVDIQKFKFKYPIFIQHFNRYFYVDEISEYTGKNQSTKIVLMGI